MTNDPRSPFQSGNGKGWKESFWWFFGIQNKFIFQAGTDYGTIQLSISGNTLSWYVSSGDQNSTTQCNYTGSTYFYIGIGAE